MALYNPLPTSVPPAHEIPHYHGDAVRALLVILAVILIVAEGMGAALPLGTVLTVALAVILVLAAGITNPAQKWIHVADAILAGIGTILFGSAAIGDYRADGILADPLSFTFALALALVSLIALYLSTRTIRGMLIKPLR